MKNEVSFPKNKVDINKEKTAIKTFKSCDILNSNIFLVILHVQIRNRPTT